MNNKYVKLILPHAVAIAFFLVLSITYFSPIMEGKVLKRHDISTWKGMSQEMKQFNKETGENTLWTNSMFGGMPTYLISNVGHKNVFNKIHTWFKVWKSEPVAQVYLYLIGFYLALLAFGVSPWLSIVGAVAFAFSSYFFIIIQAGHATKAFAIGYMAPIIGGVYLSFKKKPLAGAVLMALFLALQIRSNHLQITYYTLLIVLVFGITWLVKSIKEKSYTKLVKPILYSVIGAALAVGSNATQTFLTYEYGKYSIRGASELTHNEDNQTSGLDKDYAMAWSYGKDETFTFLIPNFKGGASGGALTEDSETFKLFAQAQGKAQARKVIKQLPLYWGTQPMTSGPVYIGAIICFLFVLGLILIKGPLKWWLLAATILSILLGWGHNLLWFNEFFLDYFPGYNKFRTVSMTLVIAEFTMPLLAILGLKKLLETAIAKKDFTKALYWAFGVTGGLSLFFAMFAGMYHFVGSSDAGMQQVLAEALQADRESMFRADAFRSFIFIALTALLVYFVYNKKLKVKYFIPILLVLVLADMWPVNKRYLNEGHFAKNKKAIEQQPTKADQYILKDPGQDFRVLNLTVSTFNDATTSFFHKSIGGYHGAKMRRYQELIDFHISKEMQDLARKLQGGGGQADAFQAVADQKVLRMLNTKYVIINPESFPIINTAAMGNAWFVNEIVKVANADEEIQKLASFVPEHQAIVDKRFEKQLAGFSPTIDSMASIKLEMYKPNYLKYKYSAKAEQLAVFSEIYYPKGWQMTIDGEPADYFRANYVLRAAKVPAGEHTIEWQFKPSGYDVGNTISYASSAILLLVALGLLIYPAVQKRKEDE
jgi:hypothetical protein